MWIYEHQNWPNFTWDSSFLAFKLAHIRYEQGKLLGRMERLGFELQQEATLNTIAADIINSSAIEGEYLNQQEVRSSIARKLGLNIAGLIPSGRNIEGTVEMMLDATQNFDKPLTKERLFDWHAALFPTGRSGMHRLVVANWRTTDLGPMQVISGPIGKEKIHFEAPHAAKLESEMSAFLNWFEKIAGIDPVIIAGIAHLWFVTIHPFEDGNGRIARAIGDMSLARADGVSNRFYSLSSQIEAEQKEYYNQLEEQQKSDLDITRWLDWFLSCLGRAISNADKILEKVLFKSQVWKKLSDLPINDRQRLIINRLLDSDFKGFINTSKYAKLAKCSNDTALRDIQSLNTYGLLIQNPGGGRSTSYRFPDQLD